MEIGEDVVLPVGIRHDGGLYRNVKISEMTGYDDENLAKPAVANNGAVAVTTILRRCVQGIEGLVEQKKDPFKSLPHKFVREMMTQIDRDFLLLSIKALDAPSETVETTKACPSCNARNEDARSIADLEVFDWPEDADPEITLTLPRPVVSEGVPYAHVVWRFPTGAHQELAAKQGKHHILTSMLAASVRCFLSDKEEVDPLEPDSELLRRMSTNIRTAILTGAQENSPGLNLAIDFTCESCGHEFDGMIDVSALFSSGSVETRRTTRGGKRGPKRQKRR